MKRLPFMQESENLGVVYHNNRASLADVSGGEYTSPQSPQGSLYEHMPYTSLSPGGHVPCIAGYPDVVSPVTLDIAFADDTQLQETLKMFAKRVFNKHSLSTKEARFIAATIDANFDIMAFYAPSLTSPVVQQKKKGSGAPQFWCFICPHQPPSKQRLRSAFRSVTV
jgi:hypothetical protein